MHHCLSLTMLRLVTAIPSVSSLHMSNTYADFMIWMDVFFPWRKILAQIPRCGTEAKWMQVEN